jgi:hypothetical protein
MKKKGLTKKRMAEPVETSRTQIDRLLNPCDHDVTLVTLEKAAAIAWSRHSVTDRGMERGQRDDGLKAPHAPRPCRPRSIHHFWLDHLALLAIRPSDRV